MQALHGSLTRTCTRKPVTKNGIWTLPGYKDKAFIALSQLRKRTKFNFHAEYWGKNTGAKHKWRHSPSEKMYGHCTLWKTYPVATTANPWRWLPVRPRRTNWTKPTALCCCSDASWQRELELLPILEYLQRPRGISKARLSSYQPQQHPCNTAHAAGLASERSFPFQVFSFPLSNRDVTDRHVGMMNFTQGRHRCAFTLTLQGCLNLVSVLISTTDMKGCTGE